jgi:hypothetical protein
MWRASWVLRSLQRLNERFAGLLVDGLVDGSIRPLHPTIAAQLLAANLNAAAASALGLVLCSRLLCQRGRGRRLRLHMENNTIAADHHGRAGLARQLMRPMRRPLQGHR